MTAVTTRAALAADPHCRNCGARTAGDYCAVCGQETRVALPTARQFMREATGRLIAWDGRLWRTLYALAFRPGSLTKAYLAGRRRYYVRPARLFLAMALILFAVIRFEIGTTGTGDLLLFDAKESTKAAEEPAVAPKTSGISIGVDENMKLTVGGPDSYLAVKLRERFDRFNRLTPTEKTERLVDGALRYGTYVIFLLLPVFAVLQMVSYIGRARSHPGRPKLYAEHLVYAAHLHTFWFLVLIAALVVPWQPVRIALGLWVVYYVGRAKRNVYGGPWWARLTRSLFVATAYGIAVVTGIAGLMLASILLR
ncbi:MAG: DUF3667 domain-containing protein [Casimicrobiaceae bacterium]